MSHGLDTHGCCWMLLLLLLLLLLLDDAVTCHLVA